MKNPAPLRLLIERATQRIVLVSPAAEFAAPTEISIVTFAGMRRLGPDDWHARDWDGETPPGFNAQTSYLFMLTPSGAIVEIEAPRADLLVVI